MVPVEWTNSRSGISLLPGVAPIAPAETPPVSHQTPVETPAVSQPTEAETLISQRVSLRRSWKLKASIAVAALMLIPPVLWLLVENQYLSQTLMGRWVGSVASRRSLEAAGTQPAAVDG